MNEAPKGKIGRLPKAIQEQVNRRLEQGDRWSVGSVPFNLNIANRFRMHPFTWDPLTTSLTGFRILRNFNKACWLPNQRLGLRR